MTSFFNIEDRLWMLFAVAHIGQCRPRPPSHDSRQSVYALERPTHPKLTAADELPAQFLKGVCMSTKYKQQERIGNKASDHFGGKNDRLRAPHPGKLMAHQQSGGAHRETSA
jgi:hypothetical protein